MVSSARPRSPHAGTFQARDFASMTSCASWRWRTRLAGGSAVTGTPVDRKTPADKRA